MAWWAFRVWLPHFCTVLPLNSLSLRLYSPGNQNILHSLSMQWEFTILSLYVFSSLCLKYSAFSISVLTWVSLVISWNSTEYLLQKAFSKKSNLVKHPLLVFPLCASIYQSTYHILWKISDWMFVSLIRLYITKRKVYSKLIFQSPRLGGHSKNVLDNIEVNWNKNLRNNLFCLKITWWPDGYLSWDKTKTNKQKPQLNH